MEDYKAYFKGKTAVVTGGASGIGLALGEEMLECGAAGVALADFNRENLKKHEARLNALYPGRVKGIYCDVTKEDMVADMVAQANMFFNGKLDILINNAGAGFLGRFADAGDFDPETAKLRGLPVQTNEDWTKGFALNFYGSLFGCRAAIPLMLKQGSGQIVNVISGIAFCPMPYQAIYSATKAALNSFTLALRAEFREHNIRFNSATPGTTATHIWDGATIPDFAQTPQQSAQRILKGVANNERLILGDDNDLDSAKHCFDPAAADGYDLYLKEVARKRKAGEGLL